MEIKRSSWHYRWLDWTGKRPWRAKTLCEYIWLMFMSFLQSLALVVVVLFVSCVVGYFLYALIIAPLAALSGYIFPWEDEISMRTYKGTAGMFWPIVLALVSMALLRHWIFKLLFTAANWKFSGEPGLLRRALKDIKEKTCTIITFK